MKILTLYTTGYQSNLKNFLAGEPYREQTHDGLTEGVYRPHEQGFEPLARFLEYIAILEHPVYRNSEKLTNMALELEGTEIHNKNIQNLADYAQENDSLHLEGYTAFRMAEYRMKLDMMMYYIVKSLKIYSRRQ